MYKTSNERNLKQALPFRDESEINDQAILHVRTYNNNK